MRAGVATTAVILVVALASCGGTPDVACEVEGAPCDDEVTRARAGRDRWSASFTVDEVEGYVELARVVEAQGSCKATTTASYHVTGHGAGSGRVSFEPAGAGTTSGTGVAVFDARAAVAVAQLDAGKDCGSDVIHACSAAPSSSWSLDLGLGAPEDDVERPAFTADDDDVEVRMWASLAGAFATCEGLLLLPADAFPASPIALGELLAPGPHTLEVAGRVDAAGVGVSDGLVSVRLDVTVTRSDAR